MGNRRTVVLAVIVASALTWPPTRRLVADLLITAGANLDHLDDPPGPSPEQRERMHRRFVDELADALVRRGRGGRGDEGTNRHQRAPACRLRGRS